MWNLSNITSARPSVNMPPKKRQPLKQKYQLDKCPAPLYLGPFKEHEKNTSHNTRTANAHYAISATALPNLSETKIYQYQCVSLHWHLFLGLLPASNAHLVLNKNSLEYRELKPTHDLPRSHKMSPGITAGSSSATTFVGCCALFGRTCGATCTGVKLWCRRACPSTAFGSFSFTYNANEPTVRCQGKPKIERGLLGSIKVFNIRSSKSYVKFKAALRMYARALCNMNGQRLFFLFHGRGKPRPLANCVWSGKALPTVWEWVKVENRVWSGKALPTVWEWVKVENCVWSGKALPTVWEWVKVENVESSLRMYARALCIWSDKALPIVWEWVNT
ncbi:hypothetical protein CPB85DRAFT_1252615 [Mucidula mucida]|nr:hypothetical protein CPB85DRAFT_1252615 [Mucidula mucida]